LADVPSQPVVECEIRTRTPAILGEQSEVVGAVRGGNIDGINFSVTYPQAQPERRQNVEMLWAYLIAQSAADTDLRLTEDAALWINPPRFTVQMNPEGTSGFTVAMEQLLEHRALWVPAFDVYLTTSRDPLSFSDEQKRLEQWKGQRILERVHSEPEATYAEFASRWPDTGNPNYEHPRLPAPGHIVCLTWDSAIPKLPSWSLGGAAQGEADL
jgi:hypothetical protein